MGAPVRTTVVLCAMALAATACFSTRGWWDRVQPADFPARVAAIVFPEGRLDRGRGFQYGSWTVELGQAATAVARFGRYGATRVDVRGLTCKNKVVGTVSCSMALARVSPMSYHGPHASPCALFTERHAPISIVCPIDFVLDR
jgi:hypothetical protein